jgi:DNA-binding transcriptional MerR regulator
MVDIGDVVAQSGVPTSTLHLWEREGLITPVGRAGLRRQYDEGILQRLAIIVIAQRSRFSLNEIRSLLTTSGSPAGRQHLVDKLDDLRTRRAELDTAIESLEHALACAAPSPLECPTFLSQLDGVLPVQRN